MPERAPDSVWKSEYPLVLASQSAVRSSILAAAGLPHVIFPVDIDERTLEASLTRASGEEIASKLAKAKGRAASIRNFGSIVIGADQTLDFEGALLHKPGSVETAREHLRRLRGRSHKLHSAVSVWRNGTLEFSTVSTATLEMRNFSEPFLDVYMKLAGASIASSVGCYHIEGLGIQLFERIDGDQFTIMGLPLLPLLGFFRQVGYVEN